METKKAWDTTKKLPFWLRRVDVPVHGQAAAETKTEFNWWLVFGPLYALGAALAITMIILFMCGILGLAVSAVQMFPIVGAIALLIVLFKRK